MDADNVEATNPVAPEEVPVQIDSVTAFLRLKVREQIAVILLLPADAFLFLVFKMLRACSSFRNSLIVKRIEFGIVNGKERLKEITLPFRIASLEFIHAKRLSLKSSFSKYRAIVSYYWQKLRYFWQKCTWRNFYRCSRILRVYDKIPYEHIDWAACCFPEHRKPKFKEGHVCVRLRWRKGPVGTRSKRTDPWELYESLMTTECFPVDSDGSLRIDQILKRWNIDELEFLIPGRWDLFTPSDPNRLSPLALYTLTQQHGYITVVEREDKITRARNYFDNWYRASFAGYLFRSTAFLMMILLIFAVISYVSLKYSLWFSVAFMFPACLLSFFPNRRVYGWLREYEIYFLK